MPGSTSRKFPQTTVWSQLSFLGGKSGFVETLLGLETLGFLGLGQESSQMRSKGGILGHLGAFWSVLGCFAHENRGFCESLVDGDLRGSLDTFGNLTGEGNLRNGNLTGTRLQLRVSNLRPSMCLLDLSQNTLKWASVLGGLGHVLAAIASASKKASRLITTG